MKLTPQCFPCLVTKAATQLEKAGLKEEEIIDGTLQVTKLMIEKIEDPEFKKEFGVYVVNPAAIGTVRNNFLIDYSKKDPYVKEKEYANEIAMTAAKKAEIISKTSLSFQPSNIVYWLRLIAIANSLEFDLEHPGKDPVSKLSKELLQANNNGLNQEFEEKAEKIVKILQNSMSVIILTDNTGEHVFDMLFAQYLVNHGKRVIVAGKASPTQNDATIKELIQTKTELELSIHVEHIGSNTVGLFLKKVSENFLQILMEADLVIAKGMGHFESFNSVENLPFKGIVIYKAKCEPVAKASGIKKGQYNILPINLNL